MTNPEQVPQWSQPAAPPPAPPQKKAGNPVVGFIVLAIIGGLIWYFFLRSTPPTAPGTTATRQPPAATAAASVFTDIVFTGQGDSVKQFSIPTTTAAIATLSHSGSSNFIVTALAADGSDNDLLVNTIGNYAGTVLFDTRSSQHSTALQIEADGQWSVTIKHPSKARAWNPTSTLTGRGDDVVQVSPTPTGLTPVTLTHTGDSNFIVEAFAGSSSDLMVNEIGAYSGTQPLPAGTYLVAVEAEGSWTIAP